MLDPFAFVPTAVNSGPLLTAYTLPELRRRVGESRFVLPVCAWGTPPADFSHLGGAALPPLYRGAIDAALQARLLERVHTCFPFHELSSTRRERPLRCDVVEVEPPAAMRSDAPVIPGDRSPRVVAFSVDTAVEQHGPHLPLATDTIQSYAVLRRLAAEIPELTVLPPLDYGQLTWGLPFGMSVDISAELLTQYVTGYANLIADRLRPAALYVVDVHGSIVHRTAIQAGLAASRVSRHAFRWLHEPLVEFAGDRGDQHAGGVETALLYHIDPALVDARWFPARIDELAAGQMSVAEAAELSSDLPRFFREVESRPLNGIVGDIRNVERVDARLMMGRMLDVARADLRGLLK